MTEVDDELRRIWLAQGPAREAGNAEQLVTLARRRLRLLRQRWPEHGDGPYPVIAQVRPWR